MPKARDLMNRFRPKTATAIEAGEHAVNLERERLAEYEAAVRRVAREAHKSGADLTKIIAANALVSAQRDMLRAAEEALEEAHQAERQRLIDLAVRANQAKVNALKQHLLAREKTAQHLQAAIKNVDSLWLEMQAISERIRPLVPQMDWNG